MSNLKIYCVTNKVVNFLSNLDYEIGWVGQGKPPKNYISCNEGDNIFYKEKYFSELTFQYWYWKNLLNLANKDEWVGFCQKRRFWVNREFNKDRMNDLEKQKSFLNKIPLEWKNYESVICEPIDLSNVKIMKMFKRGFKSIVKDPLILFSKKKHTINLHFDMHHGHGNLIKAANLLNEEDKSEFIEYINTSTSFNPHIMFVAKPHIANLWFSTLFLWLSRCEKIFGFDDLKGYDTQRLYAYLAERYLSFWFKKHTNYLEWPWVFYDSKN